MLSTSLRLVNPSAEILFRIRLQRRLTVPDEPAHCLMGGMTPLGFKEQAARSVQPRYAPLSGLSTPANRRVHLCKRAWNDYTKPVAVAQARQYYDRPRFTCTAASFPACSR